MFCNGIEGIAYAIMTMKTNLCENVCCVLYSKCILYFFQGFSYKIMFVLYNKVAKIPKAIQFTYDISRYSSISQ